MKNKKRKETKKIKKKQPETLFSFLFFLFLTLLIVLPLYRPGYIFLLDFVWGPQIQIKPSSLSFLPQLPINLFFRLLNLFFSTSFLQKIFLHFTLFFSGISMYLLASSFLPPLWATLSGVFYILNPYVYERLSSGHIFLLLGYAFFPFLIKFFQLFLEKQTFSHFLKFTLLFTFYPLINLHWAYFSTAFLVFYGLIFLCLSKKEIKKRKSIEQLKCQLGPFFFHKRIIFSLFLLIFWVLVNFFWIKEILFPKISPVHQLSILLPNYWYEKRGISPLAFFFQQLPSSYFLSNFFILFISSLGAYSLLKKKNVLAFSLLIFPLLYGFLFLLFPLSPEKIRFSTLDFLRDFEGFLWFGKLTGISAFTYALFFPYGALIFAKKILQLPNCKKIGLTPLAIISGLIFFLMLNLKEIFWGLSGEIQPYDYPKSWYQAKSILEQGKNKGKTLILPWETYLSIDFAGNTLARNPLPIFFGENTLAKGKSLDSLEKILENHLLSTIHQTETLKENLSLFKSENITHIILGKINDFKRYDFLEREENLIKILETPEISLYRLK